MIRLAIALLAITAVTNAIPMCKIPMQIQGTLQTLDITQASKSAKPQLGAASFKFAQDFKMKRIRLDGKMNGAKTTIIEDFVKVYVCMDSYCNYMKDAYTVLLSV